MYLQYIERAPPAHRLHRCHKYLQTHDLENRSDSDSIATDLVSKRLNSSRSSAFQFDGFFDGYNKKAPRKALVYLVAGGEGGILRTTQLTQ